MLTFAQADTRQRRPSQQAQREGSERKAFSGQQRACLQDDPAACERALTYSKLTPKDRAVLQAKRSAIIAVREAAKRERSEAEAAERVRLEQAREQEAAAARQAEILAYNMAQVPRISPVWMAVAVLAAIVVVTVAMLLVFVAEARAACVQFKAALRRARVLRALWPTPATALVQLPTRPAPASGNRKLPTDTAAACTCGGSDVAATPARDTTGAIAALELAQAYLEEVRDAEVPGYADATLRKLHLNTLALATRQLERGKELDPDAFLEGNDAQRNPRRLGFDELKAEALLLEGLTHQANDVRRAIVALAASTELRPPGWTPIETRLTQAIGNLLQNAAKFTPRGGRVTVALALKGDAAEIRVTDTGAGIDPALLPHVFEPFVQADRSLARSSGGLGLGLSVVRGIAEQHGGSVTRAQRRPGAGAEFALCLPLTAAPAQALHPRPCDQPGRGRTPGAAGCWWWTTTRTPP